jgi:hypothetical protein
MAIRVGKMTACAVARQLDVVGDLLKHLFSFRIVMKPFGGMRVVEVVPQQVFFLPFVVAEDARV